MIRLSACVEMLFRELDFTDRISAAWKAGLAGAEFWGWQNKNIDEINERRKSLSFPIVACTIGSRDNEIAALWRQGGLVDPDNHDIFLMALVESIGVAKKLDIPTIIVTVGQEREDVKRSLQHQSIVDGLKKAAPVVEKSGITLVVEPLNILINHKGYYLYSSQEGFEIVREINSPNIKLLYDIYHQQVTEGNLIETIEKNIDLIGHFHAADVPGRNEPGTGEINYRNVLKAIERAGYQGYVGLEYSPRAASVDSLKEIMEIAQTL